MCSDTRGIRVPPESEKHELEELNPPAKIFYGWKLLAAVFVIMFVLGGTGFFVLPIFITELEAEFGWGRTVISNMVSVCASLGLLITPIVGFAIDRFGARQTMVAGALLYVTAQGVMALMNGKAMLYAGGVLGSVGLAFCLALPAQTLVTRWFDRYRGRAMGIMTASVALGGVVFVPATSLLIGWVGWRWTFGVIGLIALTIPVPLIAWIIRSRPEEIGLLPDGRTHGAAGLWDNETSLAGVTVRRAVMSVPFALLFVISALHSLSKGAVGTHLVPFLQGEGFTLQQAANVSALVISFGFIGTLAFGWLADRFSTKGLLFALSLLYATSFLVLVVCVIRLDMTSDLALILFAVSNGLGLGGVTPILPMLVALCFGPRNISQILGLLALGWALGAMLGPSSAGWIFVSTGSYEIAWILCFSAFAVAGLLTLSVSRKSLVKDFAVGVDQG